ncbi:unnamed protein product, partial [marine sediment metagenome]
DAGLLAKLNSNELFILNETTTDVLLGQITPEGFSKKLKTRLKISDAALGIINGIIENKIFRPLYEDLEKCKNLSIPKPDSLKQKVPQETGTKEPIDPSESPKIEPSTKERIEQQIPKQIPAEPIISEYSFPEPSKVVVEKPVRKMEELKKVVTPKVSSEQQEKIREKLLAAMQKKNNQPKIVEEMRKIFLKPKVPKETEEKKRKVPGKIKIGELTPSKILSGEGKKFKDEEIFEKSKKEKPYILGAKLKEEKEEKERPDISKEPIPYKKYQKKNPFGEA